MLESSRMLCGGVRVPLRFADSVKIRGGAQGAGALSLFPGAIVALKGKNGSEKWFLASEILAVRGFFISTGASMLIMNVQLPPIQVSPTKPDLGTADSSFSATICCGPYTPDSDLKFVPWQSLLKGLKKSRPAVVILASFALCFYPPLVNNPT